MRDPIRDALLDRLLAEPATPQGCVVLFQGDGAAPHAVQELVHARGWRVLRITCGAGAPVSGGSSTAIGGGPAAPPSAAPAEPRPESLHTSSIVLPVPLDLAGLAGWLPTVGVPDELRAVVFDLGAGDFALWRAWPAGSRPPVVVVGFDATVAEGVEAAAADEAARATPALPVPRASSAAWRRLGQAKGYRLVQVRAPAQLVFVRDDHPLAADPVMAPVAPGTPWRQLAGIDDRQPAADVTQAPWEIVVPPAAEQALSVATLSIRVLADKHDVQWYQQRKTHEESRSLLYHFLREAGFGSMVDVGASVGYVTLVAARAIPGLQVVSIEADPRLARLLRANLRANLGADAQRVRVVNAVVGDRDEPAVSFSLNPGSTLDNRVHMPQWQQLRLPMRRLDTLLASLDLPGRTFFKIDTQGYELHVLRGLEQTLRRLSGWVLKMEFAPDWLRSQGTDPLAVLDHLQARYEFAEFPERIVYGTPGLDALFAAPVGEGEHARFVEHVTALAARNLGWVDLIVRPRAAR